MAREYGWALDVARGINPNAYVSSRQRTPGRNAAVGGVSDSYHLTGDAWDIAGADTRRLSAALRSHPNAAGLDIIDEGDHVHIEPGPGRARSGGGAAPSQLNDPIFAEMRAELGTSPSSAPVSAPVAAPRIDTNNPMSSSIFDEMRQEIGMPVSAPIARPAASAAITGAQARQMLASPTQPISQLQGMDWVRGMAAQAPAPGQMAPVTTPVTAPQVSTRSDQGAVAGEQPRTATLPEVLRTPVAQLEPGDFIARVAVDGTAGTVAMVGRAARAVGRMTGNDTLYQYGTGLNQRASTLPPALRGSSALRQEAYEVGTQTVTSAMAMAGGLAAGGALVAGGATGTVLGIGAMGWAGALSGGTLFGLAEGDRAYDQALAEGKPENDALAISLGRGFSEGGFEFANDLIIGKLVGVFNKVLSPGAYSALRAAGGMAAGGIGEVSSELANSFTQNFIDGNYGLSTFVPWDKWATEVAPKVARQTAEQTLLMTGAGVVASQTLSAGRNELTPDMQRRAAAGGITPVQPPVPPAAVNPLTPAQRAAAPAAPAPAPAQQAAPAVGQPADLTAALQTAATRRAERNQIAADLAAYDAEIAAQPPAQGSVADLAAASRVTAQRRAEQARVAQDLADFDAEVAREQAAIPAEPVTVTTYRGHPEDATPRLTADEQSIEGYFSHTERDAAETYTGDRQREPGDVRQFTVTYRNPADYATTQRAIERAGGVRLDDGMWVTNRPEVAREATRILREQGYDASIDNSGEVVVFDRSQIREAPRPAEPVADLPRAGTVAEPSQPAASPLQRAPENGVVSAQREPWQMTRREYVAPYIKSEIDNNVLQLLQKTERAMEEAYTRNKKERGYVIQDYRDIGLTRKEYNTLLKNNLIENRGMIALSLTGRIELGNAKGEYAYEGVNIPAHEDLVQRALAAGKPVPAEVLAEYPDLARQTPQGEGISVEPVQGLIDIARNNNLSRTDFIGLFNDGLRSRNLTKRETAQRSKTYINDTLGLSLEQFHDKYIQTTGKTTAIVQTPAALPTVAAPTSGQRGTPERLYSGMPLTSIIDAITASDQAQYIRSAVTELGQRAYNAGKRTFGEWRAQLREWLGAAFDKVRPYLRSAYNAARQFAADEAGAINLGPRLTPTQRAVAAREQTDKLIQQKAGTQPGNVGQRPDLAKPSGDEVIRTAFDEIDEIRTAAGQPERKKQDKTRRDAANVVLANPKGTRLALMQKFNDGQTWTDDETAQAAVIINVPGTRAALLTGTPQIKQEVNDLINAYREQGTRGARAQAIRRDQFMTPEERANNYILQALTRPLKNGKQLTNEQRDNIVIQLKERGVDLGSLTNQVLSDPVNVWNIIHVIQQERADTWDAMYEYWINGILSLPTTHMANVIGNSANTVIDMTLQRVIEAGLNSVVRNPSAATFGEFREMQRVIAPAIRFATQNAIMAGRLQESYLEKWVTDNALAGGRAKFLEGGQSISGTKGRIFRAPGTALVIEDEFAKSFIARVQVAAEAYRSGKAKDLSGQALTDHINEETTNTGSEAWRRAIEYAQELTFQKETGKYVGILENARATFPPLKFLVPFVRTLVNVAKREAQMSVLGAPIMAVKYKQGKYEGEAGQQQAIRDASSTLIGIGLTGVMAAILSGGDDDELPVITGTRAYGSSQGERELENRTMPSMTVRIGNRQYSYARISPVSTSLALAADIGNMILGKEDIGNIMQRIQQLVKDRTMMQGVNDVLTILQSRNGDQFTRNAGKFGANFISSWVPNIVRGAARNSDEFIRNDYIWGKWQEIPPRAARRVGSKIVSPSNLSYPMVDMWGRDVRRHTGISPYTDFVYDMFIPARGGEKIIEPVDMLIRRYNSRNPEEPYLPESPEPRVTRGGETVYMTDRQYYDIMKQSGALALQRINSYRDASGQPLNYRNPTTADIEVIKKIRETANAEVSDSIMGAPASRTNTTTANPRQRSGQGNRMPARGARR
jgi:hypothetical protein